MNSNSSLFFICILISFAQCTSKPTSISTDITANTIPLDSHTAAVKSAARSTHLSLNLIADFESKTLSGSATHSIQANGEETVYFDVKALRISHVLVDGAEAIFTLSPPDPILGSSLTVPIKPESKTVEIQYTTTAESAAVQWLDPQQTADKKLPFLFTQGQAILSRTWIPCQDSPGIRITYDAHITCPPELLALMSATNPTEKNSKGQYHFTMAQPIPPYLIALAIGDIEFAPLGNSTGVYAEPSMLAKSAYEFVDMQKMLEVAENLYGPYLWERYDVLVLPPSFPFGGMENPRLTFATPTILAGDRSLTSLVAHELAHSWSGNLVTNATWDDFWLNEGFTVYFERRIMEKLYGADYAQMLAMLGAQDLQRSIDELGANSEDTHLHLHLEGRDPDDGMTDIAYEKGANFLLMLEKQVGREKFDLFLKNYFEKHKFQTLTTTQFIDYLNTNLLEPNSVNTNVEEWIYGPGLPSNFEPISSDRFTKVEESLQLAVNGDLPNQSVVSKWTTHEWLHFIRLLPDTLSVSSMQGLDKAFGFADSGNSEIAAAWFEKAIKNGYYENILPQIDNFLVTVGRRKFLTPLYSALIDANDMATAKAIYTKARPNYHAVSVQTMDELIK